MTLSVLFFLSWRPPWPGFSPCWGIHWIEWRRRVTTVPEQCSIRASRRALTGLEKSFLCQSQNCLGCHFSGRIFFHLGRSRAPRLKSLGAKKKRSYLWGHLLHTSWHEHHQWNGSKFLLLAMKIDEMQKKKKKKRKRKKERKKKKTTRKKLGPLHSHETLRGRGRSCWLKADKKFASRAKRKRKRRKRNEKCTYMCEQTWHHHGRLKQFWLQQCTMLESAVLTCLGLLRFQLHFTCGATLFLSFEVRTCCDSAVDFTGKKVASIVAIFKKSKSPVIFTCLSKESALPGVFVDFSGIKLSLRTCRSNLVSFHFTQTFPEKSLSSPIMPCSRAFFNRHLRVARVLEWGVTLCGGSGGAPPENF